MAIKTLAELRAEAQIIKNETTAGANTATRVGGLIDDILDSGDSLSGGFWQQYRDGTYTVSNKLAVLAGVRTPITIDGVASTVASPNGYPAIWNTSINKVEPLALDDFYTIRLDIKGESDVASVNRFDVEMDIGGSLGVISARTEIFAKGAGITQSFSPSSQFFVGATFLANGGAIYLTPLADANFWDIGITISRSYKAAI